jgi:hypothetical protein
MQNASTGGFEFQLRKRPEDGGGAVPNAQGAKQVLYILLLIPGVFVSLFAVGSYPPLDSRPVMGMILGLFLLPVALQVLGFLLKRPSNGRDLWRIPYIFSSLALVLFAFLLFLKGGLDRWPRSEMRVTVMRKMVLEGRRATQYYLAVSSWRPGKTQEDIQVSKRVFDRAVAGRTVVVELHQGRFGLAWYGKVLPE